MNDENTNQSMPITSSAPLRDPHEPVAPATVPSDSAPETKLDEQLAEVIPDVATTERPATSEADGGSGDEKADSAS